MRYIFINNTLSFSYNYQYDHELSNRHFGVELSRLTNEDRTVPVVLEKLISYIEMHGLYTEGIYRKPGSTNKIRELRQILDTGEKFLLFADLVCSIQPWLVQVHFNYGYTQMAITKEIHKPRKGVEENTQQIFLHTPPE